jgi:hypothetical protein
MTIVATWYREKLDAVWCISDSRLTSGHAVLTDSATKILTLPVATFFLDARSKRYLPHHTHQLGFAFAGNSLAATTTFGIASTATQALAGSKNAPLPSILEVAKFTARCAEHVVTELALRTHQTEQNRWLFAVHIFGFCRKRQQFDGYQLTPNQDAQPFTMEVQRLNLCKGKYDSLGTGKEALHVEVERLQRAGLAGVIPALSKLLASSQEPSVGGNPQCAVVDRNAGVRPAMHLDTEAGQASICGLNQAEMGAFADFKAMTSAFSMK